MRAGVSGHRAWWVLIWANACAVDDASGSDTTRMSLETGKAAVFAAKKTTMPNGLICDRDEAIRTCVSI